MPGKSLTYNAVIVGSVITPPSRIAGTTPNDWSYANIAPDAGDIRSTEKCGNRPMARVSTRRNQPPISPRTVGRVNPVTFLQETIAELRKSVWPSKEETTRLTAVVIVLAIVMSIFLGGLDRIFQTAFTQVIFRQF